MYNKVNSWIKILKLWSNKKERFNFKLKKSKKELNNKYNWFKHKKQQLSEQRQLLSPKIFISDFQARAAFGNNLSADNSSGEYVYDNVVFITIYFNLENLGEEAYHFKISEKIV